MRIQSEEEHKQIKKLIQVQRIKSKKLGQQRKQHQAKRAAKHRI